MKSIVSDMDKVYNALLSFIPSFEKGFDYIFENEIEKDLKAYEVNYSPKDNTIEKIIDSYLRITSNYKILEKITNLFDMYTFSGELYKGDITNYEKELFKEEENKIRKLMKQVNITKFNNDVLEAILGRITKDNISQLNDILLKNNHFSTMYILIMKAILKKYEHDKTDAKQIMYKAQELADNMKIAFLQGEIPISKSTYKYNNFRSFGMSFNSIYSEKTLDKENNVIILQYISKDVIDYSVDGFNKRIFSPSEGISDEMFKNTSMIEHTSTKKEPALDFKFIDRKKDKYSIYVTYDGDNFYYINVFNSDLPIAEYRISGLLHYLDIVHSDYKDKLQFYQQIFNDNIDKIFNPKEMPKSVSPMVKHILNKEFLTLWGKMVTKSIPASFYKITHNKKNDDLLKKFFQEQINLEGEYKDQLYISFLGEIESLINRMNKFLHDSYIKYTEPKTRNDLFVILKKILDNLIPILLPRRNNIMEKISIKENMFKVYTI